MIEISQLDLQQLLSHGSRKVHLIGVAGSGMSGLARLLAQRGHEVTGSDVDDGASEQFQKWGVRLFKGHSAEHILSPDFVCYSSAIPTDNPELVEAQRREIPIFRRARVLASLVFPQKAIVVAGMHGKTTTTSMIAHILKTAGKDPSFFVGANVPNLGTNASIGSGDEFVIEADESDGTMSEFKPEDLVLLNIEPEHLDFYPNLEAIEKAFQGFAKTATGRVLYGADDRGASKIGAKLENGIPYRTEKPSARGWWASHIELQEFCSEFELNFQKKSYGKISLGIPGAHNVSNAVAALAIVLGRGVDVEYAKIALKNFVGAKRRFEKLFESDEFLLVDDYAHHPTEIRATIEAAKSLGRKRVVIAFQPHRYTRTKALQKDFGMALSAADRIYLTDIYAASETPISGVDGMLVAKSIGTKGGHSEESVTYAPDLLSLKEGIGKEVKKGDLLLIMGAGSISSLSQILAEEFRVYHDISKIVSADTVLKRYEPMSKRTSMRTGGTAKLWVEPASEDDLVKVLKYCAERRKGAKEGSLREKCSRVMMVGRGSNLLVRDAGISGVTIHLGAAAFSAIQIKGEKVIAGAGARLKQVVMAAKKANLTGLEFLEGIPGSLGGGLWMNAGAMGNNVFDAVETVRFMDFEGNIFEKTPSELDVVYRSCRGLKGKVVLSGTLQAKRGKAEEISAKLKEFEKKRWTSQPAAPSAGCIFKNPVGNSAGKLIDELGLKGLSFGRAKVSEVHGNFIVNAGGATTAEIMGLMTLVRDRVKQDRGLDLETEVIVIGDDRW